MYIDGDTTVTGVVAERWRKDATQSEVEPQCIELLLYLPIAQVQCCAVLLAGVLLYAFSILPCRTEQNVVCGKVELHDCNRRKIYALKLSRSRRDRT